VTASAVQPRINTSVHGTLSHTSNGTTPLRSGGRFALLALVVTSCVPSATGRPEAAAPPLHDALGDDYATRFPARALVDHYRSVRVTMDGPVVTSDRTQYCGEAKEPPALEYPVVEASPWPRVVIQQNDVRLLVYVSPSDVKALPIHDVRLAPTPGAAPDAGAGVTLGTGCWIDVVATQGEWLKIRHADHFFEFGGWIRSADVGPTFVPAAESSPTPTSKVVRAGASLAATPGGESIGRFVAPAGVSVVSSESAPAGFAKVHFERSETDKLYEEQVGQRDSYRATGYVRVTDIDDGDRPGGASMGGCASGASDRTEFKAGSRFYDRVGGTQVGAVVHDVYLGATASDHPPWLVVYVDTFWGSVPVFYNPN
jgi:hypothetical protein